jgi:hypothetical protein
LRICYNFCRTKVQPKKLPFFKVEKELKEAVNAGRKRNYSGKLNSNLLNRRGSTHLPRWLVCRLSHRCRIRGDVVTAVQDGFFTVFLNDVKCHLHIPFRSAFEILESKNGIKGSCGKTLYPLVVQLHHPGAATPRPEGEWWMGACPSMHNKGDR